MKVINCGVVQSPLMEMDTKGARDIMTATTITIETDMRRMETWKDKEVAGQEGNEEIDERGKRQER